MIRMILSAVLLLVAINNFAQEDSIEVFLIDSFVTPETPHTFIVSFFTSVPARAQIIIENTYDYEISADYSEQHKAEIDVSDLKFEDKSVQFIIIAEDSLGNKNTSELYEFEMPYEPSVEGGSNFVTLCLFGGTTFLLPSPVLIFNGEKNYIGLTKEIPVVFIRSSGIGYPTGYFSLEYSHIFNAPRRNFLRYGYKHIMGIPGIEYISPGVNGFTDFKGFNGISPEISLGLFRIADVFTFYTRYRYNFKPGEAGSDFQELTIGLYSGFFALYF